MKRQKMNLLKKVTTLEEFEQLLKKDTYPLVIILDEIDQEILENITQKEEEKKGLRVYHALKENYHQTDLYSDSENNKYIKLSPYKLQKRVLDDKVVLKKMITPNRTIHYIDSFFVSDSSSNPVKIGLISKRTFLEEKKRNSREICSIQSLTDEAIMDYRAKARMYVRK